MAGVGSAPRLAISTALFISAAFVVVLARQALADPCPDPANNNFPYNTISKPGSNSRGVKVVTGMVYDTTVTCGRVDSVLIHNASYEDFVEIGWYEDPNGTYACLTPTGSDDKPDILAFEQNSGGFSCAHSTSSVVGGQADSFSVHDDNQDGYWTFMYAGNPVFTGAENMGTFTNGITNNNGERLNKDDVARADFAGLKRMDASQSWLDWGNTAEYLPESDDPGFKWCFYTNTHTGVIANGNSC